MKKQDSDKKMKKEDEHNYKGLGEKSESPQQGECMLRINDVGTVLIDVLQIDEVDTRDNLLLMEYMKKGILKRLPKNAMNISVNVRFQKVNGYGYKINRFAILENYKEWSHSSICAASLKSDYRDLMDGMVKKWETFFQDDFHSYSSSWDAYFLWDDYELPGVAGERM
ncbi:hypothetical protein IMZ31_22090 (plasmid) [Pontibacillus sp. ALD_SL1]|uniref:hypothetical protein n=1 Tax=Pontibacillus sp. ALD_SL1 TaxID=2777185 RepID=UPI001A961F75|nr:hypothetical protein [Pontibacillus sp. ALD_SL1]QST02145.1 hypothetical protein IMZ31_22090 [Pontibacillus sp. ALD_SL1]